MVGHKDWTGLWVRFKDYPQRMGKVVAPLRRGGILVRTDTGELCEWDRAEIEEILNDNDDHAH